MAYTLQRECAVVLVYNGIGYLFDALSQFDFSQRYNKTSGSRKTLHSKKANPYVHANSKSTASFSCSILCTDSFSEGVLFELAGLTKLKSGLYKYEDELSIEPKVCDIFIVSKTATHKLTKAAVESLEVSMNKADALMISTSFTASNLERVSGIDISSGLVEQGEPLLPTPVQYQYKNRPNKHIINAGVSIQQSIDWRNDRSLHDFNTLYVPTKAVLTDRSFGINVTSYINSNIEISDKPEYADIEIYKSGLSFALKDALVTSRLAVGDVFTCGNDITVTNKTHTAIVEYGGIWYEN